jgi:hypothetical protein
MVPELRVPHDASPGRNSNESFVLLWGFGKKILETLPRLVAFSLRSIELQPETRNGSSSIRLLKGFLL